MIRVLGVDPGSVTVGYGIVELSGSKATHVGHGCLSAPRSMPVEERLCALYADLIDLLDRERPHAAALEGGFSARNVKSAFVLGEARGVIRLALRQRELPLAEYAPAAVKLAVGGHGQASKDQLAAMTGRILGVDLSSAPHDATDALAIALCHAQATSRDRLLRKLGRGAG